MACLFSFVSAHMANFDRDAERLCVAPPPKNENDMYPNVHYGLKRVGFEKNIVAAALMNDRFVLHCSQPWIICSPSSESRLQAARLMT